MKQKNRYAFFIAFSLFILISHLRQAVAFEQYSMRACALLPIYDGVGGALGLKVFESLERELKQSEWCRYQNNSDLIQLFSRHRDNLVNYLKNEAVLRTVSEKLKVGSILRVTLRNEMDYLEVSLDIIGDDGLLVLFSEKTKLDEKEPEFVASHIKGWLNVYGKTLPYEGKVTGILGDQITADISSTQGATEGQKIYLRRFKTTKIHPLLKKVVDFESSAIAEGKVLNVSEEQVAIVLESYKADRKVKLGDWVTLDKSVEEKKRADTQYPLDPPQDFGKLGLASVSFVLGSSSFAASTDSARRMSGIVYGLDLFGELWVTRNWLAQLKYAGQVGKLEKQSGSFDNDSSSYQKRSFKIGGGYRYLPLGFFYGPQVDFLFGYASHSYRPESSQVDGVGAWGASGIYMGLGANLPITREYRGLLRAEVIPLADFSDEDSVYGSNKSLSWMQLEFGVRRQQSKNLSFDGTIEITNSKGSFSGDVKSSTIQETHLKVGLSYQF